MERFTKLKNNELAWPSISSTGDKLAMQDAKKKDAEEVFRL